MQSDPAPCALSITREPPHVAFAVAQGNLKHEDVVVTHQRRLWPGSDFSALPIDLAGMMPCLPEGTPLEQIPDGGGMASPSAAASSSDGGNASGGWCPPPPGHYSFWCVFDGHNGAAAASMAGEHVTEIVEELLPYGPPEPPDSPYYTEWCEEVQRALAEAITALNLLFAGRGIVAGCTATLVLQVGWLVTCANVGDSRCLLDSGREVVVLTEDHRVATHKLDRRRVEAMGAVIAPIDFTGSGPASNIHNGMGPLRIWPGGLCLSRAVGDFDVGESVIPLPHVCQVALPPTGGRLLLASDGVWDAFDKMNRVAATSRGWPLQNAADRMVQTILKTYGGLKDDTSIIVVDITPQGMTFQEVVQQVGMKPGQAALQMLKPIKSLAKSKARGADPRSPAGPQPRTSSRRRSSGGCFCFGGGATLGDEDPLPAPAVPATPDPSQRAASEPAPPTPDRSASRHSNAASCRVDEVARYDVAAVMGLMPGVTLDTAPGWCKPEAGKRLLKMMVESAVVWREAVRTGGSHHGTSPGASAHRGTLMQQLEALASGGLAAAAAAAAAAGDTAKGGLARAPSMFFSANVVEDEEDYATKFGHYSGGAQAARGGDASVRGGNRGGGLPQPGRAGMVFMETSVRAGAAFFGQHPLSNEPSTRAGRQFFEGVSVRAGRAYFQGDPSHRSGGSGGHASLPASTDASREGSYRNGRPIRTSSPSTPQTPSERSVHVVGSESGGSLQRMAHAQPASPFAGSDARRRSQEEEAMGLAPIRTVRFGGAEGQSSRRASQELAAAPPKGAATQGVQSPERGLGRRASAGAAALAAAAAAAAASAPDGNAPKAVRFVEAGPCGPGPHDSPMDHFTGLSHSSSILSSVGEETAA